MIPSPEWAKEYRLRQERFRHLYKDFLKTKTAELVNKLIVDPIVEEMRAQGVHEKIYHSVELKKIIVTDNGILIRIHSEYFADNGFDVALAREYGTEDHMIRPKGRGSQFNMSPEFRSRFAGANVLSWIQNGKRRFSHGHMVSGLPRLNIIQRKIEEGEYELQQQLNDGFAIWKRRLFY